MRGDYRAAFSLRVSAASALNQGSKTGGHERQGNLSCSAPSADLFPSRPAWLLQEAGTDGVIQTGFYVFGFAKVLELLQYDNVVISCILCISSLL